MEPRINKPRVFLSHSRLDIEFIEKVYEDLRNCQIEPWKDIEEIRHGRPWLEAIFGEGIPVCDSILVYFTKNSIKSEMVKKEMDAGILQKLQAERVAFLPYIENEAIREELRADIKTLQVPVWNSNNYYELLPQVVSEIWRSFQERTVSVSVKTEQVKRLQAELELEKTKRGLHGGIFTPAEEKDFKYIRETFDRRVPITIKKSVPEEPQTKKFRVVETYCVQINLVELVVLSIKANSFEYAYGYIRDFLLEQFKKTLSESSDTEEKYTVEEVKEIKEITDDLMMFGLIERLYVQQQQQENRSRIFAMMLRSPYRHVYTQKLHKFRYWLAYNKLLPHELTFEQVPTN